MSRYDDKTDEELIGSLRDGDEAVTEYLMEKYKNLVRKNAGTFFVIGSDKDDLIQEGMIGLFKAITGYDPGRDASFFTFAELCVRRQIYKAVEAGNRKKNIPLNSYISLNENPNFEAADRADGEVGETVDVIKLLADNNPESLVIDKENAKLLEQRIFDTLSDFEQEVLRLHMTGMGYFEIAKILGKEAKSVDNALNRIKNKVKKMLEDNE